MTNSQANDHYDEVTAQHYQAYRPPLHQLILSRCFQESEFEKGLDFGCGTGNSTIALSPFCQEVIGIDLSPQMISQAITHPNVSYLTYNGHDIPFQEQSFDVIALAGSWYYARSQSLLNELMRVLKSKSKVLLYDFEVILTPIHQSLGVPDSISLYYDHAVNFEGMEMGDLHQIECEQTSIQFAIQPTELAHLLLSEKETYCWFNGNGIDDPMNEIVTHLGNAVQQLEARLFLTLYEQGG